MNTEPAKQATDKSVLLAELLDPNVPKSEREHVAVEKIQMMADEIERLRLREKLEITERLQANIEQLEADIKQIHKDYGCEIQDPSRTILDHAADVYNRLAEKNAEINRLLKIVHKYKTGGLRR